MISTAWFQRGLLFCAAIVWLCPAMAQEPGYPAPGYGVSAPQVPAQPDAAAPQSPSPGYQADDASQARPAGVPLQLAERTTPVPDPSRISMDRRPGEHPLMPALRWASQGLQQMEQNLQDYSAIVVKRERSTDGTLGEEQWMFVKIRHKPFSVYMHFLKPKDLKGQEVIYVDGANDGKLLGHGVGVWAVFGTVPLAPTSPRAMQDQHYPITEMGVKNLVQRLLEVGSHDAQFGECEVKFLEGAKINDRVCTCIEVIHPVPRRDFRFHVARIYVDHEYNFPIRYESHDWPKQAGSSPELIEEYTYLDIKLNRGYTDADFDVRNPNYRFREGR
ncbi:MAG: DUF1571 domain-containing protein [Pirellulales bacterium]|nr:DUF1571 domain-containing protein [Pirellulales bacterium]